MPVSAGEVAAHDAALVVVRDAEQRLVEIILGDDDVAGEHVHLRRDQHAPAVVGPGVEIDKVAAGATPGYHAVARLVEADGFVFVCLFGDLERLLRGLVDIRHAAAGEGEVERVEQRRDDVAEGRVRRFRVLPDLELVAHLFVVLLHDLEKRLLVELFARRVLDEFYYLFHLRKGVSVGGLILPAHGYAGDGRGYFYSALDQLAVHCRGVAGHVVRDKARADLGVVVVYRNAGGVCAQAAGVGRQADAFHDVHVKRGEVLIHICAQKALQNLKRQRLELGKARDYLGAHGLLEHDKFIGSLGIAEAAVTDHAVGEHAGRALHDRVHVYVRGPQRRAAQTGGALIDHVQRADVAAEPAVLEQSLDDAHGGFGRKLHQYTEVDRPLEIVIEGVLQAAPLAVLCDAAALVKAFSLVCHHILPPWSFFISMLSTKAWNLVRSWPAEAIVYSFSTPMQGMPSTSLMS